ncbi:hypothetical protein HO173_003297 [Letharia columbiana]|uniref:Chromo domain-containing protein n=1 Tax=Letharia columbiana TaxID=112416 RepID=A0A8H6G1R4_9LECA|nr:uncharacterized protein HO173_003297 [Letharia columbiana]KAF6238790.1 hypothetical protein HO173_003297 [Letharia columbiana]
MASVGDVPVICGEGYTPTVPRSNGGWGGPLNDYDLIEVLDSTGSSSKDPLDLLSYKHTLDLKGTELYAGAPSNGLDLSSSRSRGGGEEDENFPSFEELVLGAGAAQESQQSGLRLGEDKGANTDSSSSVHSRSDGSTSEQGGRHCSLNTPRTSVAGSEAGCSILREKTEDPVSGPPPPLPTTLSSSTYITGISFKNIEPCHSCGGEEKGDKGASYSTDNIIPYSLRSPIASPNPDSSLWRSPLQEDAVGSAVDPAGSSWMWSATDVEPVTAMDATDIQGSSKRTADSAGLNDGGGVQRVEEGPACRSKDAIMIDKTDDINNNLSDLDFARIRSQPKPVFRRPPFSRKFPQYKKTTSLSRSSEFDDPLVVEDNDEKTGETDASTRATSVESEIDTIHLQSSHPKEQPKTHGCWSLSTSGPTTEPTTSPFDRPNSPSIVLSHDRIEQAICGGNRRAAVTVHPPHAITVPPPLAERHQDQGGSALDEEEWEIVRIVGKRRRGKGYEYKVCWKETWLLERELGNAQELLREFEAKHQAQRGGKRGRPARADKGR